MNSFLLIRDLRLKLFLGVGERERSSLQQVSCYIKIFYPFVPQGAISDDISSVFCYDELCKSISAKFENKEFKLLEHLAYEIYLFLKSKINYNIELKLKKIKVPIDNLLDGVNFVISDER